jgi:hypothetical protein
VRSVRAWMEDIEELCLVSSLVAWMDDAKELGFVSSLVAWMGDAEELGLVPFDRLTDPQLVYRETGWQRT